MRLKSFNLLNAAMQRQFLTKQTEEYRAKLASLDRHRAQKEAERDTIAGMISKLEADQPLIRERYSGDVQLHPLWPLAR
jgi:hypothetical protein